MTAAQVPEGAVFPPYRESRVLVLVGFTGLSIMAHAFTFLLFQVVYPQRVTIPPPAQQVALLTASTPEQEAILRWVAAEDPALAAGSSVAVPPRLFQVPYRPSFETLRTPTRTPPAETERPEQPPSPITLPLLPESGPAAAAQVEAGPAPESSADFQGDLAARSFQPGSKLRARSSSPLQPATFLVGVNAAGEVRHVFLQRSSGEAGADRAAAEYLSAGKFTAGEGESVTWGTAVVTWGYEVYQPAKKP